MPLCRFISMKNFRFFLTSKTPGCTGPNYPGDPYCPVFQRSIRVSC